MKLNIKQMNYEEAKQISKWIYKEPYSIYSMDESENCINELLNGYYYSVSDIENNLVGIIALANLLKFQWEINLVFMI